MTSGHDEGRLVSPVLEQRPGEEILDYEYDSTGDRVGRVRRRAKALAGGPLILPREP